MIEIVHDPKRSALIERLTETPAADWRLSTEDVQMVLAALKAPGVPPEAVMEVERLMQNIHRLSGDTERQYKRTRFVNRQLVTVHGLLALVYGTSFAANGRLADLFCTMVWIACVAMHWVAHRRYMKDNTQ